PRSLTARADADVPTPPLDRTAPGVEFLQSSGGGAQVLLYQDPGLGCPPPRPPPRTGRSQLPQVLSIEELQRLFARTKNPRPRALLMTTYAAGLRVSAVGRLRLTDIASDRMLIRVEQGNGCKDRYTLLSTRLLTELRAYWKLYRPALWLFTGLDPTGPCPAA